MTTAHNVTRIGLARVSGVHLLPSANQTLPLAPRGPEPRRIASEPESLHNARVAAVRRLGTNWVLHPAYTFHPRHSTNPEVWGPARAAYFSEVRRLAAEARSRNPLARTVDRVRAALQHEED